MYNLYVNIVVQFTEDEEARALPILLRHSPGMLLPNRTYLVAREAMKQLQRAGVQFVILSWDSNAPSLEKVASGERI
jgi:hypothetical protein